MPVVVPQSATPLAPAYTIMIVRTCLRQRNAISNVQKPICSVCTFAPRQLAAAQDALTLFPPPQALPLRSPAAQCQSRRIHAVPSVGKYDTEFKEEGVPGLLTPESYNIAWTDYQKLMVSKLNTSLAGTLRPSMRSFSRDTRTDKESFSRYARELGHENTPAE